MKRKIKIQVVELKYSRVMENKFLGNKSLAKILSDKKSLFGMFFFVAKHCAHKNSSALRA